MSYDEMQNNIEEPEVEDEEMSEPKANNKKIKLPKGMTQEELVQRCKQEYSNALDFRRPRIAAWHANEDLLYGKKQPSLTNRSNINIQLAAGFEDSLLAKIKNPPILEFKGTEEADDPKGRKVTAFWKVESDVTHADWEFKDSMEKKLAIPTGRAITKIYSGNQPYKHQRDVIDPYDFLIDPMAGGISVQNAKYLGQDNIFKSKYELQNPRYDKKNVAQLIASFQEAPAIERENVDNEYKEKANRFYVMGLDLDRYNLQKDGIYKLVEWYTTINGERWYVVFSHDKDLLLKSCPLEDVNTAYKEDEQPLWPFSSWAYYPDAFNFWSAAPLDKVREIFLTRNVVINQIIDSNESKVKPMKSYDPYIYNNPKLLTYMPDRLVPVKPGTDPTKGLYVHPSPDIYDPKELNIILEDLAGKISGITPAAQGSGNQDQPVGIYYGDQQEIAGRMSLFEQSYSRANVLNGELYLNGLRDNLDEDKAIRMIGLDGFKWEMLKEEDLGEFDIVVSGGVTQAKNDALKAKAKNDFIASLMANPLTAGVVNTKFAVEQGAIAAGMSPDEAKRLVNKDLDKSDSVSRAAQDIQNMLLGKPMRPYLKADTAYMQKFVDFVMENELDKEQELMFAEYVASMQDTVIKTMTTRAALEMAAKGQLLQPQQPGMPMNSATPDSMSGTMPGQGFTPPPQEPAAGTLAGTEQMAGEMTNSLK